MKTYAESRELKPYNEHGFHCKVPREVIQHHSEGETLNKVEKAKDNPVGEPLDVIMGRGRLDSLEGEVGREEPADKVGDWSSEGIYS
jgi:hypothetical protein